MAKFGTTHIPFQISEENLPMFEQDFEDGSWITENGIDGHITTSFDTVAFPLTFHVARLLINQGLMSQQQLDEVGGLDYLHKLVPPAMQALDTDEVNDVTKLLYEQDDEFTDCYRQFVKHICDAELGQSCVFQKTPTIRVHFPNQSGFDWKPRYHLDVFLGHPPQEVNLWIPLTKSYGTNTMVIAKLEESLKIVRDHGFDFSDFPKRVQTDRALQEKLAAITSPATLEYGAILMFDSRCLHAAQFNQEETTRISIDIRVMPESDYGHRRINYVGTGRRKMQFICGEYYDINSTDSIS